MHNQIKRMNKYVSVSNVSPTIIAFFNITAAMMVLMMLKTFENVGNDMEAILTLIIPMLMSRLYNYQKQFCRSEWENKMRSRRFLGTARWGTGENNDDDDDVDVENRVDEGNHGDGYSGS